MSEPTLTAPKSANRSRRGRASGQATKDAGVVEHCLAQGVASSRDLIEIVRRGLPYSELEALRDALDLPMERLATHVGMSRATSQRRKQSGGTLNAIQSDRLVRLARLVGKAIDVMEGEKNARDWLTSPQHGLGGATPLDYADTEVGAREVENLLGRIEHGVFS